VKWVTSVGVGLLAGSGRITGGVFAERTFGDIRHRKREFASVAQREHTRNGSFLEIWSQQRDHQRKHEVLPPAAPPELAFDFAVGRVAD
jgi:hypothetical protein